VSTASRWAVSALGIVAAFTGAWVWLRAGDSPGEHERPQKRAVVDRAAPGGSSPDLLYMKGSVLHRMDVRTGDDQVVVTLPDADVHSAPASPLIAYVTSSGGGDEDFAAAPELTVLDPETGRKLHRGPGVAPMWSPDGKRLAYLKPVEPRACAGETCAGAVEVAIYEVGRDTRSTLLSEGRWSLVTWSGGEVVVADQSRPGSGVVVRPGSRAPLGIPPSIIWGASPDGQWLVTAGRRGAAFVATGQRSGDKVTIPLAGRRLAEGAWAADSDRVAAVVLRVVAGIPRTRLVTLSPRQPSPAPVPSSRGAIGRPLWSIDGSSIAFARVAGPGGRKLRATWCPVEGSGRCRELLSWTDDVRLLELE
jgi:WD40-like Beta Propeller Repeat